MKKPCGHAEPTPGCPHCILYDTDPAFRAAWGGPPLVRRTAPAHALRRITRYDARQLHAGGPGPRLNPGLIRWQGRLLMAYRTGWAGAQVHLAELDNDLHVLDSWTLPLGHARASYGREDPRLFEHGGRLHLAFIGVDASSGETITHQLYARLSDDARLAEVIFAPHYSARQAWEKNWSFFSHGGELLAVYSIRPHVVLRIDGDRAEKAHETPNNFPWSGGMLRGGAPPVRIDDEYWHWFHGCHGQYESRRYNVGLVCFEAAPPFRVTRQIAAPLLEDDPTTRPWDQYCPVLFPAGAVREGNTWLVSCGVHDRWVEIHEWDAGEVGRVLLPVPAPEPLARALPCVYLGDVTDRLNCQCPGKWLRKCDLLKRDVSINGDCKGCTEYDAAQ